MRYPFIVADLGGTEQGEIVQTIGQSKRFVPSPLATMGTAGFTVRQDHPLADFLLEGDALLKIYQEDDRIVSGRRLSQVVRLITAEEEAGDGKASVATTWADPFWVLLRRLIGKTPQGYSKGTPGALVDSAEIAADVLAAANAESPSGVALGTTSPSAPTHAAGWYYKPAGEAIAQLGAAALGPTWKIRPQEPASGVYGLLDFGTIGRQRDDAPWEFGDGLLNVKSYRRSVSHEGTANRVFHLPQSNGAGVPLTADDAPSIARRGLLESVVNAASDLAVDDLRAKLLGYHLAVRKLAKVTITFDPVRDTAKSLPILGVDYDTGDVQPFRAWSRKSGQSTLRIDALVRLYQAAIQVSDAGTGTPSLTVTRS